MNQVENSESLLEKFLEECIKITEADSGSIMLLDEEKNLLLPIVAIGLDKNSEGMKLKVGEGITGWVAKHRKARIIDNAFYEKDYVRVREDLVSEVAVPMIQNDKLIGVLSLDSKREAAFSEHDALFLQIIANLSLAIFIKIKDNEELKLREKFHKTLLEISSIITKSTNIEEIFEEIMLHSQKVLKIYKSTLFLYDKREKLLKIRASFGFLDDSIKDVVYKPGEGITGTVYLNKKPIFLPSAKKDPNFLNRMKIINEDIDMGFFAYPIISGTDAVGVFSIFTFLQDQSRTKEIFEFLQILSTFISQTITIQKFIEEEKQPFIEENLRLRQELSQKYKFGSLIGKSPKMQQLFEQIRLIADTRSSVFLVGESGTGKELIASAIHYNSSRKDMPFIKINCAAIPDNLLESELFGYKKGSFTGAVSDKKGKLELANGGTVFLDEIGEMDIALQAKLLRVLQEKEIEPIGGRPQKVDIRIIAATNANIEELIQQKRFRPDLYYRLNVIRLDIPPLRERKEDIILLTKHFIDKYSRENGKKIQSITKEAISLLESYDWPGNVRELENLIERAVVLNTTGIIDVSDFKDILTKNENSSLINKQQQEMKLLPPERTYFDWESLMDKSHGKVYRVIISEVEKRLILHALKKFRYKKSKAAKFLGINRNTLDKKIRELNIEY
ncbi:MAG: sigma 54-interacting transcriptional regulator [Leptospiraceae bacterium]|nr:sigma 54-interacting transcriptional regulator [Leptospiraceae bacterium]MDW7975632.1 sigma 54-interacting transcriptional regulator [Leptospiraceae bacterium]